MIIIIIIIDQVFLDGWSDGISAKNYSWKRMFVCWNRCSRDWLVVEATSNYIYEYLTIILRGRAGYEMIYNQRGA